MAMTEVHKNNEGTGVSAAQPQAHELSTQAIHPVPLAVYGMEPSSRPSEEIIHEVAQLVPHMTYFRIEAYQGTSIVLQRCLDGNMVGMLYLGNSANDDRAIGDFYSSRPKLPENRREELKFIDLHELFQVGGKNYFEPIRRLIYTVDRPIVMTTETKPHSELVMFAPAEESNNELSVEGRPPSELRPDGIYYQYGYKTRFKTLPTVIDFENEEFRKQFESLFYTSNPMHVLNAAYSTLLSRDFVGEMYMVTPLGSVDLKKGLSSEAYDVNLGNVAGIQKFDEFFRVDVSVPYKPTVVK